MPENRSDDDFGFPYPRWGRALVICLSCVLVCLTGCGGGPISLVDGGEDPGTDPRDAGSQGQDAGAQAHDAGSQGRDAGSQGRDAGSQGRDAGGQQVQDAGSQGRDGGAQDPRERTCSTLPPVTDYGAPGPFNDVQMIQLTGPNSNYTLFRPGNSLGSNGFKHPIASWGNGIYTTPDEYQSLLKLIASHGFVIIGCNDLEAERECVSAGLDWLVAQNDSGPMAQKLDITREVTIGYSWGGGAAIDTANRKNVKATVSLHGMPPRGSTAFADMHSPLLLFTSTGDDFVTKDEYVTPNYDKSTVQTFYAVLNDLSVGHLYIVDVNAIACVAITLGQCGDAKVEQAPTVAWLRMLACDDQQARAYFYGANCKMCNAPWTAQKKAWPSPDVP